MKKDNNVLKSKLFENMKNLASDENMDESSFLASIANLVESEEYNDITDQILEEEEFFSTNMTEVVDDEYDDIDSELENELLEIEAEISEDIREIESNDDDFDLEADLSKEIEEMEDDSVPFVQRRIIDEETDTIIFEENDILPDDELGVMKYSDIDSYTYEEPDYSIDEKKDSLESSATEDKVLSDTSLDEISKNLEQSLKAEVNSVVKHSKKVNLDEIPDDEDLTKPAEYYVASEILDDPDVLMDSVDKFEEHEKQVAEEAKKAAEEAKKATSKAEAKSADEDEEEKPITGDQFKAKKRQQRINLIIRLVCIAVFIYCVGRIGLYYYQSYKWKKGNEKLAKIVGDLSKDVVIEPQEVVDIHFPDELIYKSNAGSFKNEVSDEWAKKYKTLVEMNPDCVGWLQLPDSEIDYPVMYTPNNPEKYLYRDFEGEYLYRGLPFMAEGTLLNVSQNYILYGHHMADGTAFNNICKYLNKDFLDKHKYIYFNTAYSEGVYEVMAVVITKIFKVEDECFKYYRYSGNLTEDEFNTYVYYMKKMSSYNTGVDAVYGDQLLSLSTCYRTYDPEGRLVVVFKRVK